MSKKDDYFELWFPMGLMLGASLVGLAFLFSGSKTLAAWVSEYQTLIGAILALIAAGITVATTLRATQKQIDGYREVEDTRKLERLRASRSMLPFALTNLGRYCEATVRQLHEALKLSELDHCDIEHALGKARLPAFPVAALEILKEAIELAPLSISRELGSLLSWSQIYHSRLDEVSTESQIRYSTIITTHSVRGRLIEHLELHARVARCYKYGRFLSEEIVSGAIDLAEMRTSANICKIYDTNKEIHKDIERFVGRKNPSLEECED